MLNFNWSGLHCIFFVLTQFPICKIFWILISTFYPIELSLPGFDLMNLYQNLHFHSKQTKETFHKIVFSLKCLQKHRQPLLISIEEALLLQSLPFSFFFPFSFHLGFFLPIPVLHAATSPRTPLSPGAQPSWSESDSCISGFTSD